jgi:hypothetical protein
MIPDLCNYAHIGSEAQPTSYPKRTVDVGAASLSPGIKLHSMKLISHLIIVPRLRICET